MEKQWKKLALCLAVPLAVGGLSWVLSGGSEIYGVLEKPPLSPPGWMFPVVWTALYLLMGCASYLVATASEKERDTGKALRLYALQLAANFVWPLLFFGGQWYLAALVWLGALWVLVLLTQQAFSQVNALAGKLLIPYFLWVTFALYLNLGFYLLNQKIFPYGAVQQTGFVL